MRTRKKREERSEVRKEPGTVRFKVISFPNLFSREGIKAVATTKYPDDPEISTNPYSNFSLTLTACRIVVIVVVIVVSLLGSVRERILDLQEGSMELWSKLRA